MRHRADSLKTSRPLPTDADGNFIHTRERRWLDALVARFGPDVVGSWDQVEVVPLGHLWSRIRLRVNGATFHAERIVWGSAWRGEYEWVLRDRKKRTVGTCDRARQLVELVLEHAPKMPPEGWTYADWLRHDVVATA